MLSESHIKKWGNQDLNLGPTGYESAVSLLLAIIRNN